MAFSYMILDDVLVAEPTAAVEGVSKVARSRRGFVRAYEKSDGRPDYMGVEKKTQEDWTQRRENFIARHMAQVKKRKEPLWEGGEPTRRHLALMMWAYTPTPARTEDWIDSLGDE